MINQSTHTTHQPMGAPPPPTNFLTYKTSELVEMVECPFNPTIIYDKKLIACKKVDHPLQRNTTIVTVNMKTDKQNPYDLNRKEYASLLGISPNAVRMKQRRGKLEGEYKFENGQYLFRAPPRVRVNLGQTNGHLTTPKKIYNRGNHYKANYPNEAFRLHNERKMLNAVNERDPSFINNYQEIKAKYNREKAEERAQSIRQQTTTSYGTGLFSESNKGYADPQYHNGRAHEYHPKKFTATNRGKKIIYKYYG